MESGVWSVFGARAPSWDVATEPFQSTLPDALLINPAYASTRGLGLVGSRPHRGGSRPMPICCGTITGNSFPEPISS